MDQCIDTNRFRAPVLLPSDNSIKFANYRHLNEQTRDSERAHYYIAEISNTEKENIEDTYFHIVQFATGVAGVTAAHTQFRVKFKNPQAVKLTDQVTGEVLYTNDVVISYEASRPRDVAYNFAYGAWDNYILVARAMSGRQRQNESYANETEQYVLNFGQKSEGWDLLKSSLEEGDQIGLKKFYNTIKPNCTTSVFDQLDKLPSVKRRNAEPFLVEISPDPVAGPSIQGLIDRGLIDGNSRYANLRAELDEGKTRHDGSDNVAKSDPIFANLQDYPYSKVFASYSEDNNQQLINEVKSSFYKLLPEISAKLYTSLATTSLNSDLDPVNTLRMISPALSTIMNDLNSKLTDKEQFVSIYFQPWDGSGRRVHVLQELNVQARLASDTYESTYADVAHASVFSDGFYQALDQNKLSSLPSTLLGLAVHMKLKKNASQSLVQFVAQLTPQVKPIQADNDKVVISNLVVPEDTSFSEPGIVILNLQTNYGDDIPKVSAEFGPYSGIQGFADESGFTGKFIVNRDDCDIRKNSVPRLIGNAKLFGKKTPITLDFNFFDIEFDVVNLEVSDFSLRVSPLGESCIDSQSISDQFTSEVNSQIETLKDKSTQRGVNAFISAINKMFDNNPNQDIATFAE